VYSFAIRVTDENGTGVSSYAPITIEVIDKNNKAPIPTVKSDFHNLSISSCFIFRIFHGI